RELLAGVAADERRTTCGHRADFICWWHDEPGRVHGRSAERRPLGVRLRLAHVVAGLLLQPESARPYPWLPPRAVHPFDALPRHQAQARPGDGPVPRPLLLGHRLPRPRRRRTPRAGAALEARNAAARVRAAPPAGADRAGTPCSRARVSRRSDASGLRARARPARPRAPRRARNWAARYRSRL